jgi:hypothetical protein
VVLAALDQNVAALEFAALEYRADRDLVLAAVKKNGNMLKFAAPALKADREVVLEAVKRFGGMLAKAAKALKGDREIVLAAVKQFGQALAFATPELKADRELVMAAVNKNVDALAFASEDLKADRTFALAVLKLDGLALEHVAENLKADKELVITAIKQDESALEFAAEEFRAAARENGGIFEFPTEAAEEPNTAIVFEELRKLLAMSGTPADGPTIRSAVMALAGEEKALDACALLSTFPFGGMIRSVSMLFAVVDSPLDTVPPGAYSVGCAGGDGFLVEKDGHLFVSSAYSACCTLYWSRRTDICLYV